MAKASLDKLLSCCRSNLFLGSLCYSLLLFAIDTEALHSYDFETESSQFSMLESPSLSGLSDQLSAYDETPIIDTGIRYRCSLN